MPLDSRIPLMSQAAPVNVQPGVNALLGIQNMRQQQQEQPLRNQLLETQIAGAKQTQANSDSDLKLKAAQFQNQAFRALKSIPDPQLRQMAYMSFVEHAKAMKLHDGNPDDDISDNGLEAGIKATDAFMPKQQLTNASVKIAPTQTGYDVIDPYTGMPVRSVSGVKPTIEQKAAVDVSAYGQKRDIEAKTAPIIAAGTERAKAGVELDTAPGITAAKETAKGKAVAALSLPETLANADQTMALVDQALSHPGLEAATGLSSKTDPRNFVAGTDAYNFNVLMDQIQGKAFLQAFQSLKGGGAITEIEGKKAEQAIARLNRAQSTEQFVSSLNDLKTIIASGRERAAQKAQQATPQPVPAPQQGGGTTNAKGWVLHQDAAGNKAYVGPNGEIEEVK